VLVHVIVSGAVVASIVLRVKEDIVVRFRAVASVAIIVALRLVVNVAIVVVITVRRLLRV
jgi:hypothetical protein